MQAHPYNDWGLSALLKVSLMLTRGGEPNGE